MNKSTYGEDLFERYLISQGIAFEREPELPGISQRIDFVVDHPTAGKVLLEVKDIVNPPPRGSFSAFDPYDSIREHIEEGTRKFKATADHVCALVLAAPPGSFVQLSEPHVMLGAMYGNIGWTIPFNIETGRGDKDQMNQEFLVGDGKMVRRSRVQNTRIAALISLHDYAVWNLAMQKYLHTDDGRSKGERIKDLYDGTVDLGPEDASEVGVTVWENAVASRKLPADLFRGQMDARWDYTGEAQELRFVGGKRKELGFDTRRY